MRVAAILILVLSACSGADPGPDDRNPPRLYLSLLGPEVGGQVQLVPVEPSPF